MTDVESKLFRLREHWPNLDIAIDGGIDQMSVGSAAKNGANLIVSGSHLFNQPNLTDAITTLRRIAYENQPHNL